MLASGKTNTKKKCFYIALSLLLLLFQQPLRKTSFSGMVHYSEILPIAPFHCIRIPNSPVSLSNSPSPNKMRTTLPMIITTIHPRKVAKPNLPIWNFKGETDTKVRCSQLHSRRGLT